MHEFQNSNTVPVVLKLLAPRKRQSIHTRDAQKSIQICNCSALDDHFVCCQKFCWSTEAKSG